MRISHLILIVAMPFYALSGWAQSEIDQFDLETETSFFEAHNAQKLLEESKDQLFKDQLEVREAEERSKAISTRAQQRKVQVEAERVEIEKQRAQLAKERALHEKNIQAKTSEIEKRQIELDKEKADLAILAKEVRDLKKKNAEYDRRILSQQQSQKQVREYQAQGQRHKRVQRNAMTQKSRVIGSLGKKQSTHLQQRAPASAKNKDSLQVNLLPKKRR